MNYFIRFVQMHESFRQPEIEALAAFHNISFEWILYEENVCAKFPLLSPICSSFASLLSQ